MATSLAVLHLFAGVVYLLLGGDLLIRGAVALARRLRIAPILVGLTVVALGTSAPELVVCLRAVLADYPDLAIANVVGSNIANVLLVVGLPAIVHPMACNQRGAERDGVFMLVASVGFVVLCALGPLGRVDGIILLAGLVWFGGYVLRGSGVRDAWTSESVEMQRILGLPTTGWRIAVFLALGTIALPLGAERLILGAVGVADALGVPNSVVGLTVVAAGTSLPELATTLIAAFKRESDLAVGNILGSNVLNLLAIMGLSALVSSRPIGVPDQFLVLDLPIMLLAAITLAAVTIRRGTVGRRLGALLLGVYVVYTVVLYRTAV